MGVANHNPQSAKIIYKIFVKGQSTKVLSLENLALYSMWHNFSPTRSATSTPYIHVDDGRSVESVRLWLTAYVQVTRAEVYAPWWAVSVYQIL